MIKISIILSTYNGSQYIEESILSVLNQSYKLFEFIIINDASTDEKVDKIIQSYIKIDKRIIYIKNKNNLGLTRSLNIGLKSSKGEFIARIDDDDVWINKYKLKKQLEFMEKNPEYGICGTSVVVSDIFGNKRDILMKQNDGSIRNSLLRSNQFIHSSVLIRKSILNDLGGVYLVDFDGAEDYELWLRIGKKSLMYNLPEYLVQYRKLADSISNKKILKQEIRTIRAIFKHRNGYNNFLKSITIRVIYAFIRIIKLDSLLK